MPIVTQQCLEQVRAANDLVDVMGEHVRLTGRDPAFKCCCPFHDDKTPSMSVRRDRQFYYCFGCGAKGDVFTFVQEVERLDFGEAVEWLARRSGTTLVYQKGAPGPRRDPGLLELLEWAARQFRSMLTLAKPEHPARQMLDRRGITTEERERFQLGLDPDWRSLIEQARRDGYGEEQLINAGVAQRSDRTDGIYDRFHHRLIFPIADVQGRIVGFGGRRLDDEEDTAKYINSPDSPHFNKSMLLYGAHLAREAVETTQRVIVAEGYTDVIGLHRAGLGEAVAPMGTALNKDHLRVVRRLRGVERIVLMFDGDAPGIKRACDVVQGLIDGDFPMAVALLPQGMDPEDMVRAGRPDELRERVETAVDGVEFVIERMLEARPPRDRHDKEALLRDLAPLLARIPSEAVKMSYARGLAGRLGLELNAVNADLRRMGTQPSRPRSQTEDAPREKAATPRPADRLRLGLIRLLWTAHQPEPEQEREPWDGPWMGEEAYWKSPTGLALLEKIAPAVDPESDDPYDRCLSELYRMRREGEPVDAGALTSADRALAEILSAAGMAADVPQAPDRYLTYAEQCVRRLLQPNREAARARLLAELSDPTGSAPDALERLKAYEARSAAEHRE